MVTKNGLGRVRIRYLEGSLFEEFLILREEEGLDVSNRLDLSKMIYSLIEDHLQHPYIRSINNGDYINILDNLYSKFNPK